jgi:hypothetical protein
MFFQLLVHRLEKLLINSLLGKLSPKPAQVGIVRGRFVKGQASELAERDAVVQSIFNLIIA